MKEADILREAGRRRVVGATYASTAELLNSEGLKTREGNRFTAHAMKDIFGNKSNVASKSVNA